MKPNIYLIAYLIAGVILAVILDQIEECPTDCSNDFMTARLLNIMHHMTAPIAFLPLFFFPLIGKWAMLVFLVAIFTVIILWFVLNSMEHVDKQLCFLSRLVNTLCDKHVEMDFQNLTYHIGIKLGDHRLFMIVLTIYYVIFMCLITYLKFR
jgi:hypothetical protein